MNMTMMLSFGVVAIVLGMLGRGFSKMVFGNKPRAGHAGWKGVFYVTMWAHPLMVGALVGLFANLPAPSALGDAVSGSVFWYTMAGGTSLTALRAWESFVKQRAAKLSQNEGPI